MSELVLSLRRAALSHDEAATATDGDLLGCFIERRDGVTFDALVRRHGPMVWGVCRRRLPHHDAEDAFQATFLVLVRKATSIVPREMVGNWLHGVARQTALQSQRTAARRRAREATVSEMPDVGAEPPEPWSDEPFLLDQELSRLPEKYRALIVLCDLEGRTRKEVARQLGAPEGTVAGRLARAREMLAKRLTRRGVALSAVALAGLSQNITLAGLPNSVMISTISAATHVAAGPMTAGVISSKVAALTEGALKAMFLSKLKSMSAVLLACLMIGGAALMTFRAATGQEGDRPPVARQPKSPADKGKPVAPPPEQPKDETSPWMKEFVKAYSLADGEVLKRVSKFPECRAEYIKNSPRLVSVNSEIPISMALRVHQKETNGELHMWGFNQGDGSLFGVMWQIGIPMGEVEANKQLLDTRITGDFVFRQDAPMEKLMSALEGILREECTLPVRLAFKEVEREVVVAKGTLKIKPLEGRAANHIEVYAKEAIKGSYSGGGGSGDMGRFFSDLGGFVRRRIVSEATHAPNETVSYAMHVRTTPPLVPTLGEDQARDAEDHEYKTVLDNVAKQTGLTFTIEKRKIRVLVVEKDGK
ncbi:RNA polymerase sigma factor [Zavarzinella formosa]|uniref:RNA polymerase sigma factor n=1 Tax=Zavarzinella formosa TaxID=360055 RepID=UPI00138AB6D2|nr:sigma-70 family RNA polymerase sigma factor [Zavarzinella formosa]